MVTKGTLTSWNDVKGFGFITPEAGGNKVFVHVTAFSDRTRRPELHQRVTYTLAADKQGRPCATKVTRADAPRPEKAPQKRAPLAGAGVATFFVVVGASVLAGKAHLAIFALYTVMSLLTFALYATDKSAAQNGGWRTRERLLHLLALAGGWPGALMAQHTLHHKSRKQPFRLIFWLTVLLNCAAFAWLVSRAGATALFPVVEQITRTLAG